MGSPDHTCVCYSLRALNIVDYNKRCLEYLSHRAPHIKLALLSLETLASECKTLTDRNGLEYDSYPLYLFLKELPVSLPLEIRTVSLLTKLKYLYYKRKLLSLLRDNFFDEYIEIVKKNLDTCHGVSESAAVLRKLVRVFHVLNLQPELSPQDVHQYEFLAELLNLCYDRNIQDNHLVLDLLRMTIDMYAPDLFDTGHVRQPRYPQGFFKYVLEHAVRARFDIERYCEAHPRTMWEYSSNFSVVNAVSFGNIDRTLLLLQYGAEVFSESDLRQCGHGFRLIEETMPPTFLMIFHLMSNMRSMNIFILNAMPNLNNNTYSLTRDQMECFRLIWRSIPAPYVRQAQMANAITTEFFHLARHAIFNPMRYEKNTKLCILYETSFVDLASGPIEPRSLKHLCRCIIRESLKEQWNVPHGIFQLRIPVTLKSYLNLETD